MRPSRIRLVALSALAGSVVCAALAVYSADAPSAASGTKAVLHITDQAAADKILAILKQAPASSYKFQGATQGSNGKVNRISVGSVPMSEVKQVLKVTTPGGDRTSPVAVVHSTLTDFVARNHADQIQQLLKGVDSKMYKLDIVRNGRVVQTLGQGR